MENGARYGDGAGYGDRAGDGARHGAGDGDGEIHGAEIENVRFDLIVIGRITSIEWNVPTFFNQTLQLQW